MRIQVRTSKAQSAPGLLSQAIETESLIFTSGFIHLTADGKLVEGSIQEMFTQVISNVEETLIAAGLGLDSIVKVTIYLTDISILQEINKIYVTYFKVPLPARETVCVKALPLGAQIEMSVVATKRI